MKRGPRATVLGWDIGGVNTKVARVVDGQVAAVIGRPFEIQHDPSALRDVLRTLAAEVGGLDETAHAVTMTAELSQVFLTKREGVSFVLDAVEAAFPSSAVQVYTVDGRFLPPGHARTEPLAVAAANWAATARVVAWSHPTALLIDIGTTSADVIPIVGGTVVAHGWNDPERLASGELVYTGALRTPVEALASHVPFGEGTAGISAEGFALAGDVHVWRGDLAPADYTVMPPDRRPPTREFAGGRLARAICADRELLDDAGVSRVADALADAQLARVTDAVRRVCGRHHQLRTAVVTGLGAFIAVRAALAAGLDVVDLAAALGEDAARCAPAASVALLLCAELQGSGGARADAGPAWPPGLQPADGESLRQNPLYSARGGTNAASSVDLVVKIGGGLLANPDCLARALSAVADAATSARVLVVPGGGPFADVVREVDRAMALSGDATHWMAILAMDQYAYLLADCLPGARIVTTPREAHEALDARRIPVLAPARWIREADPLPHSWDVTSDSIAAWVAARVGATRMVLVKPPGAEGPTLVDDYFSRVLPETVTAAIVPADRLETLRFRR